MSESADSIVQRWLHWTSLVLAIILFSASLISVNAGTASQTPADVTFSKTFMPDTIGPGSVSTLRFDIVNTDSVQPVTDLAFTDNLPAGVVIATPANAATTCSGILSAPDGGATISLSDGRLSPSSLCIVTVDVTSGTPGTVTNESGDLTSNTGNHGNATADLTVDASRPGFRKSFSPNPISPGDTSTLILTIDNTGNELAADYLSFVDLLPTGMIVASPANASTDCSGGFYPPILTAASGTNLISLLYGFVNGSSSCSVAVDVTTTTAGRFGNTTGDLASGITTVVSSGRASAILDVNLDFLNKVFTDDPVAPGGTVTLEFTILNENRTEAASNITFQDNLDAVLPGLAATGLPLIDPCGAGSQLSGTSLLNLTGGSLAPGGTCTFSTTLQVPAAASSDTFTNTTSSITADIGGKSVEGRPATDQVIVEAAPLLTKSFIDDPVVAGGTAILGFSITNTSSTSGATDIAFTDELDAMLPGLGVTLPADGFCGQGSTMRLAASPLTLEMTGGSLGEGASCTFSVTLTVSSDAPGGTHHNTTNAITAMVDDTTVTGKPASDDLVVVSAPMLKKLFTDGPVNPGGNVTLEFTLAYDHNAPAGGSNIAFDDDLEAVLPGLVATGLPISDVCGAGSQLSGTSDLSFFGGSLAPGESCTFSTTLQVPDTTLTGSYTNTTSDVTATVLEMATTGKPASAVLQVAGLTLQKSFTDDPSVPGGTTTLEFTLSNTSPISDVTNVAFGDDLNATVPGLAAVGLPKDDVCGAGSRISGTDQLSFSDGSLASGASCTFSITLQVPSAAPAGEYHNTTSPVTAEVGGTAITASPASDDLTVLGALTLAKSFTDDPAVPGDTVLLQFTISNTHPTEGAASLSFTDDLDAALPGLTAIGLPADDVCGTGSQVSGTSLLAFTGGSLAPEASCTFTVTLQVPPAVAHGTTAINTTSQVTGLVGGVPVTGSPAMDELRINTFPFNKSFDGPTFPGGNPILSFTIQNLDPSGAANGVSFSDNLNAVLPGLVSVGPPAVDVCGSGSLLSGPSLLTLVNGSLAPGASCTFSVTLQVPSSSSPGSFINTTSDLLLTGIPASSPATATLTVEPFFVRLPSVMHSLTNDLAAPDLVVDRVIAAFNAIFYRR